MNPQGLTDDWTCETQELEPSEFVINVGEGPDHFPPQGRAPPGEAPQPRAFT